MSVIKKNSNTGSA